MAKPKQSIAGPDYLLSDKGLAKRAAGQEKGASQLDQFFAGISQAERKKQKFAHEAEKMIEQIPKRYQDRGYTEHR